MKFNTHNECWSEETQFAHNVIIDEDNVTGIFSYLSSCLWFGINCILQLIVPSILFPKLKIQHSAADVDDTAIAYIEYHMPWNIIQNTTFVLSILNNVWHYRAIWSAATIAMMNRVHTECMAGQGRIIEQSVSLPGAMYFLAFSNRKRRQQGTFPFCFLFPRRPSPTWPAPFMSAMSFNCCAFGLPLPLDEAAAFLQGDWPPGPCRSGTQLVPRASILMCGTNWKSSRINSPLWCVGEMGGGKKRRQARKAQNNVCDIFDVFSFLLRISFQRMHYYLKKKSMETHCPVH